MRRTVLTVLAATMLVFAAGVIETPADEGYQGRYTPPPTSAEPYINPAPVWHRLAQMSPAERANAVIDLEREEPLARDIEHLWNTGHHDRALEMFPQLAPEEIGVNWRVPIAAPEADWGVPVEVSTRDSVLKVKLAADTVTGNLFCALYYLGDGSTNHWSINISTNGGQSWSETATWFAGYIIPDIALTVVSGHAYVGYIRAAATNQAATRRYRVTNGTLENFPSGSAFFTLGGIALPDTLRELALSSNALQLDNRLFPFFNARSGQSRAYSYSVPAFSDTWSISGMPGEVSHGLDLVWNDLYSAHPLMMSFINPAGRVRVWGVNASMVPDTLYGGTYASNGSYTALAVWKDTVHIVFDFQGSSVRQVRYLVRYGPAGNWFWGPLGDSVAGFAQNAAATGDRGDGVGVTFWQYPQGSPGQCFRHRPYQASWSAATTIQQGLSTMSTRVPAIARVAPGVHGVVFYRGTRNGVAYFNRNDWTGIAEPDLEPVGAERRPTLFVRGQLELRPAETGELFDASGRRLMQLAGGTNDLRGLAPGVYFLGIEADGAKSQQKLILAD